MLFLLAKFASLVLLTRLGELAVLVSEVKETSVCRDDVSGANHRRQSEKSSSSRGPFLRPVLDAFKVLLVYEEIDTYRAQGLAFEKNPSGVNERYRKV